MDHNPEGYPQEFRPELISLLLETHQRKDLLDTESLRALRASCKHYKELVDNAGALRNVRIRRREEFLGLLKCPNLIQRMEKFELEGWIHSSEILISDVERMISMSPRRLIKISLQTSGKAGEALAHGQFPQLTYLELRSIRDPSKLFGLLGKVHLWPLQELRLSFHPNHRVSQQELVEAIARFPQLRKLTLRARRDSLTGNLKRDLFEQNSFQHLEVINLLFVEDQNFKFLEIFPLPSLKRLMVLSPTFLKVTHQVPWIKQLEFLAVKLSYHLSLEHLRSTFQGLNAAPLKELRISDCGADPAFVEEFNLPDLETMHFTQSTLPAENSSGVFQALAKANLPALQRLHVSQSYGDEPELVPKDLKLLMSRVPFLTSLKTGGIKVTIEGIKVLATMVLPQLQECCLGRVHLVTDHNGQEGSPCFSALVDEAIKAGVSWSQLKTFQIWERRLISNEYLQITLLPATALFPNIVTMKAPEWIFNLDLSAFQAVVAAAQVRPWYVREVQFSKVSEEEKAALKQIWPLAKIV